MPARHADAEKRLRALAERAPVQEDASVLLARVLEDEGRCDEALAVYQSLSLRPGREREALLAIARLGEAANLDSGRCVDALDDFSSSSRAPRRADIAERLVALRKGQKDRAWWSGSSCSGSRPTRRVAGLRDELLALYAERGQWERTAAILERAIEASPDDPALSLRSRKAARNPETSRVHCAHSMWRRLRARTRRTSRSDALSSSRPPDAARRPLRSSTPPTTSMCGTGRHFSRPSTNESRPVLRTVDRVDGGPALETGSDCKGPKSSQAMARCEPREPPVLRRLAKLASRERDLSTAIDCYNDCGAWKMVKRGSSPPSSSGEHASRPAAPVTRLAILEEVLNSMPSGELRAQLRKLYGATGARRKEAELLLGEAALASDAGTRVALLVDAAELLERDGAWDEAVSAVEQARAESPASIQAVVVLARILAARGERNKGIELLATFAQLHGPDKSRNLERVYRLMAEMHLASDDLVEAFEALSQAHRLNRADPEIAFQLGLAALDVDELDVAASALRAFVTTKVPSGRHPRNEPSPASRAYFYLAFIEHTKGHDDCGPAHGNSVHRRMSA